MPGMGATAWTSTPITLSMNFAAGQRGMLLSLSPHADHLKPAREAPPLIGDAHKVAVGDRIEKIAIHCPARFLAADAQFQNIEVRRVLRDHSRLAANDIGAVGFPRRFVLLSENDG